MKEKFENRRMYGPINVACKYDDGSVRYWSTTKQEVVAHIVQIVDEYEELGYTLSLRQLHYRLVAKNWIVNHQTAYKRLGVILDDCRYSGLIDWDAIEDRGRVPYIPYSVNSVEHALEDAHDTYRRNRQEKQTNTVELWTEKDALSGILRRSTQKYHIRLVVNKGYTSSSAIYEAYQRVIENVLAKRYTTILYFGDHDPSGLDMVRDIRERFHLMLTKGQYGIEEEQVKDLLEVVHIGLTRKQVHEYDLPPNPTKMTDSRSDKYIEQFGPTCWEVDALDPEVLTQIVEDNIAQQIDLKKYQTMVKTEEKEKNELRKIIDNIKK